ncbi:MAG: glycosyltransferase family 2 protein [Halomonadaceae bacterium]|nr:MAG: glycosyltransferase family 2 protein [Halomonadaceae bacterium]
MPEQALPSISVVVPVLNEERFIENTLSQLFSQSYPDDRVEFLIVDGGSTDNTVALIESQMASTSRRAKLITNPKGRSSAGRNLGICAAQGDFVLFVDGHVFIPHGRVLQRMGEAVVEQGAEVLGRPQPLTPPGLSCLQQAIAGVRTSPLGHSKESFIYSRFEGHVSPLSVGVMYKRSLFSAFGLFNESFDAAEDVEFNYRLEKAGITAYVSPEFAIEYYPRSGLRQLFRQMERYGIGRTRFIRQYQERIRAEMFVPLVSSGLLVMSPFLYFAAEPMRPLLVILAVVCVLMVMLLAAYPQGRPRPGWTVQLLTPVCFVTIHLGLASGILKGMRPGAKATSGTATGCPSQTVVYAASSGTSRRLMGDIAGESAVVKKPG